MSVMTLPIPTGPLPGPNDFHLVNGQLMPGLGPDYDAMMRAQMGPDTAKMLREKAKALADEEKRLDAERKALADERAELIKLRAKGT